jgi:hypothetical protein
VQPSSPQATTSAFTDRMLWEGFGLIKAPYTQPLAQQQLQRAFTPCYCSGGTRSSAQRCSTTDILPGAFAALIFISAAGGFAPQEYNVTPSYKQSDKALHFIAFFLLTLTFYWILETSRRKVIHYTLIVITLGLGVASEVVQGLLPVSMLVSPGGDRPTLIGLG